MDFSLDILNTVFIPLTTLFLIDIDSIGLNFDTLFR